MKHEEIIKRLREPFAFKDIEWKIQVATQDKARGMAVAYINSRAIQNRLDETLGAFNWQNTFTPWRDKAQLCGISVYDAERGEWVTKYDGAENTDIEPIKGGLSDSFKRSACVWGIGRYLYELGGIWVEIEQRGKSSAIKDNQYAKLEAEYNRAVAQMFGAANNQARTLTPVNNQTPAPVQQQTTAPVQHQSTAPVQNKPTPVPQPASKNQPFTVVPTAPAPTASAAATADSDYWVQSVTPGGKESQRLELINSGGEVVSAYIRKSDKAITPGSRLQNVEIVQKQNSYGLYNIINGYQVAA
jgi:hypothetical protein